MNYPKSILLIAISTIAVVSAFTANGQNAGGAPPPSAADFVTKATLAGKTEVLAARVALKNSQSADVHTFAERMIKDHTAANVKLASMAENKSLPVPPKLDAKHRAAVAALRGQTGAAFDAAYAKQMVLDHEEAVALFNSEAGSADPDLSAFAQKTLPTLKDHKSMADALAAQHAGAAPQ